MANTDCFITVLYFAVGHNIVEWAYYAVLELRVLSRPIRPLASDFISDRAHSERRNNLSEFIKFAVQGSSFENKY